MDEPINRFLPTFRYQGLPGVVTAAQADRTLEYADELPEEPGLWLAQCPLCSGTLRCKLLPGDLEDLFCTQGCSPAAVAQAVSSPRRVAA